MSSRKPSRVFAFVGSYGGTPGPLGGGIYSVGVRRGGRQLTVLHHTPDPCEAGYIICDPDTLTLYVVDERKTDGRGPVSPPAGVHALAMNPSSGSLSARNWRVAPGPRPTHLSYSASHRMLFTANHGDFQHIEKVRRQQDGTWRTEYLYDDSTICAYAVEADGAMGELKDVIVLEGQGPDPNGSLQNGGHAQASPHAHCAVVDPSGNWLLVCDKGTDQIHVLRIGSRCQIEYSLKLEPETGPRHLAFDMTTGLAYVTCEFSSELATLSFDVKTGRLGLIAKVLTVAHGYSGRNEPAEVRVHPKGGLVYTNNRGEDSLAWFRAESNGQIERCGSVPLARSIHPGLAARSFAFDSAGQLLLVADRPAHLIRCFSVSHPGGELTCLSTTTIPNPACVAFVELHC